MRLILIAGIAWVVATAYLWHKATARLTPAGQARYWRIFLRWGWTGRREYRTPEGWRYRRLTQIVAWSGIVLLLLWISSQTRLAR